MITLDATLQAAMDGDVHHPIIRLLSKKSVDDIPFIGNVFTTSEYETKPKFIVHSSGRIIGFNLKYFDANNNHLYMFKTDTDRLEFTIDTPILTNLVPTVTGRNILDFALVELTNGDIGIVYIRLNGSSYELRATAIDVNGTVKITDYLIVSDTQIKRSVAINQQPDNSYFIIYNAWVSGTPIWGVQTRTSATFASASWSAASNIVTSLAVTPINTVYNIPADFCLIQDGTDLLLFFSFPEILDANNNPLYNVYYATSSDNGATWGAATILTDYTVFGSTGKYPSAVKNTDTVMYLSYTEEAGSLVLGYEDAGWNGGNASGPTYCMLDIAGQKIYVVLGVINQNTEWQVAAILQIDIATWSVTNKIDYTTVPALPLHFQSYWGSGAQRYSQTQYGNKVVIGNDDTVGLWDANADTFKTYYFGDNPTYGTVVNVSNIPFPGDNTINILTDFDEERIYLILIHTYSGNFSANVTYGYIDMNDVGPMYTLNVLFNQDLVRTAFGGNFKHYGEELWCNYGYYSNELICWSSSGSIIYDFTRNPTGISYNIFNDYVKYQDKIYFTFAYKGDTGYENQKGLGIFDPATETSRFVIPSYKTADDYGFYKMTLNEDLGEIYIGTNVDGIVIFNIITEQFTRLSNEEITGITPNNTDNFYGNGGGPVYDSANDRFFTCSYNYRAVVSFLREGKFKQTLYKLGTKTTGWAFSADAQLINGSTALNAWLNMDEGNKVWCFWQKDTNNFTDHFLAWDVIEPFFDITNYVVTSRDIELRRTVDGKPNELSFALSHGHLFDPSNQLSIFSSYARKGRKLTFEAGEMIGGVAYYQNQGTFFIIETSIEYSVNVYPEITIRAEDKRYLWSEDNQTAIGYVEETPENILNDFLTGEIIGLLTEEVSIPTMQGSISIDAQWAEVDAVEIINTIAKRFGYFPKITVDDIFTLGLISDSASVVHTYTDKKAIMKYTPDDNYSSFINRIIVTGEEKEEIDVLFAEERVATLNGTAGWWGHKKTYDIYYSDDGSRRVRYPRLVKLETTSSIMFELAGSVDESINYIDPNDKYCTVKIDCPDLIPYFAAALGIIVGSYWIPDLDVSIGPNPTLPIGRYIGDGGIFLALNILGSMVNYQYEIWGVPVGNIRRSVQYTENDELLQQEIGRIIRDMIEGFACYTVADCRFVAEFEMMIQKLQRKRVTFSKIAHLQDEEGDTIQVPHPYTNLPIKLFISDIKRKWKFGENGYCIDDIEGWRI